MHAPEVDVGAWRVRRGEGRRGVRGREGTNRSLSRRHRAHPPARPAAPCPNSPDGFLMPGILDDFLPVLVFFTPAALGAMIDEV